MLRISLLLLQVLLYLLDMRTHLVYLLDMRIHMQ
jgi:hypothetical protein